MSGAQPRADGRRLHKSASTNSPAKPEEADGSRPPETDEEWGGYFEQVSSPVGPGHSSNTGGGGAAPAKTVARGSSMRSQSVAYPPTQSAGGRVGPPGAEGSNGAATNGANGGDPHAQGVVGGVLSGVKRGFGLFGGSGGARRGGGSSGEKAPPSAAPPAAAMPPPPSTPPDSPPPPPHPPRHQPQSKENAPGYQQPKPPPTPPDKLPLARYGEPAANGDPPSGSVSAIISKLEQEKKQARDAAATARANMQAQLSGPPVTLPSHPPLPVGGVVSRPAVQGGADVTPHVAPRVLFPPAGPATPAAAPSPAPAPAVAPYAPAPSPGPAYGGSSTSSSSAAAAAAAAATPPPSDGKKEKKRGAFAKLFGGGKSAKKDKEREREAAAAAAQQAQHAYASPAAAAQQQAQHAYAPQAPDALAPGAGAARPSVGTVPPGVSPAPAVPSAFGAPVGGVFSAADLPTPPPPGAHMDPSSSGAFNLDIPQYGYTHSEPYTGASPPRSAVTSVEDVGTDAAPPDTAARAAGADPWRAGMRPTRWYAYEDIQALEERNQKMQIQLMATAEERDRLRGTASKLGRERDDAVKHIHSLEASFKQQASAYSAKMQAELAQEREYSRSLEASFKDQAARFTQSLKAELQAELEQTRSTLGQAKDIEAKEKSNIAKELRTVRDDADRYRQEAQDRARATQSTLERVAQLERELAEKKASEKRLELQLRHLESSKGGADEELLALKAVVDAETTNRELQESHAKKLQETLQKAEDEWKEIERGLHKQIEGEANYSKRLLDDNNDLRKQIGDLQGGYFKEVEELVYLRWVNACLRFELRRKKGGGGGGAAAGGFSALDLSYEMNPDSQKLAMALMHDYSAAEKKIMALEKLRGAGKISTEQFNALSAPDAENLAGNFKGMLGPQMEKNMRSTSMAPGQKADAIIQLLAKGVPGLDVAMGGDEGGGGGGVAGAPSALTTAIESSAKEMEEARAVGKIAPKKPNDRDCRKASKPPVSGKVGSSAAAGGPRTGPGGIPPPPPPGMPPPPPGMPGMLGGKGMKGAALAIRGSKWKTIKHTMAVISFYQQIMKRDAAAGGGEGGGGAGAQTTDVRAEIRGEIEGRSSHMLAVKKDVEVQGPFVEELAQEVRDLDIENGSMEDLCAFVAWLDHELDFLVDENAVLKHFDWPEDKADALREAAAEYRVLRALEQEVRAFEMDSTLKPEECLVAIEKFFDKADGKVTEKAKERDGLVPKYRKHKIPSGWLQDSGAVGDVKHATIRLARLFCQTIFAVSEGMQSGDSGKEEEMNREFLVMQGVKFAFRVHQFAGGFDEETLKAFESLRLLASAPGGEGESSGPSKVK